MELKRSMQTFVLEVVSLTERSIGDQFDDRWSSGQAHRCLGANLDAVLEVRLQTTEKITSSGVVTQQDRRLIGSRLTRQTGRNERLGIC